jgi:hypothetical protein
MNPGQVCVESIRQATPRRHARRSTCSTLKRMESFQPSPDLAQVRYSCRNAVEEERVIWRSSDTQWPPAGDKPKYFVGV